MLRSSCLLPKESGRTWLLRPGILATDRLREDRASRCDLLLTRHRAVLHVARRHWRKCPQVCPVTGRRPSSPDSDKYWFSRCVQYHSFWASALSASEATASSMSLDRRTPRSTDSS